MNTAASVAESPRAAHAARGEATAPCLLSPLQEPPCCTAGSHTTSCRGHASSFCLTVLSHCWHILEAPSTKPSSSEMLCCLSPKHSRQEPHYAETTGLCARHMLSILLKTLCLFSRTKAQAPVLWDSKQLSRAQGDTRGIKLLTRLTKWCILAARQWPAPNSDKPSHPYQGKALLTRHTLHSSSFQQPLLPV